MLNQDLLDLNSKFNTNAQKKLFSKPIFIVSAPRSGSTLLFETLIHCSNLWSIRAESHRVFARFPSLQFENEARDSACLNERHSNNEINKLLRLAYLHELKNSSSLHYISLPTDKRPSRVQFLEKTPRNALNIPFLLKVFPDAQFIYLHRRPEENINSIIEGWEKQGSFVRFRDLPGWDLGYWCFVLPKGWRELNGASIAEIAAFQWRACNDAIMQDLSMLPASRKMAISYDQLIDKTPAAIKKICQFGNIKVDKNLHTVATNTLPLSSTTVSTPDRDKWRSREKEIVSVLPSVQTTIDNIKKI